MGRFYMFNATSYGDSMLRKIDKGITIEQRLAEIRKHEMTRPSKGMDIFDEDARTARQIGEYDEFMSRTDQPLKGQTI